LSLTRTLHYSIDAVAKEVGIPKGSAAEGEIRRISMSRSIEDIDSAPPEHAMKLDVSVVGADTSAEVVHDIIQYICGWMVQHISRVDMRLAYYAHGIAMPTELEADEDILYDGKKPAVEPAVSLVQLLDKKRTESEEVATAEQGGVDEPTGTGGEVGVGPSLASTPPIVSIVSPEAGGRIGSG
jgi:hypothetical protein